MIKGVAEYLNIDVDTDLLLSLYNKVKGTNVGKDFNVFGKTPFESYSLEYNMSYDDKFEFNFGYCKD